MKNQTLAVLGWCCALTTAVSAAEMKQPANTPAPELNQPDTKAYAAELGQEADAKLEQANASTEEYQAAADLLAKAAALDPDNLGIWLKAGWVYQDRLHDPVDAYPYLNAVVKRQPDNLDARKLLGLCCSQTGRLREAAAQFDAASKLKPGDIWIMANLGRALAHLGEWSKAESIYNEILSNDPKQPDARLGQAELAAWRGHSGKALEILDQLIQENPNNVDALTLRGDVYRWSWHLKKAEADYNQALGIAPSDHDATAGLEAAQGMGAPDVTAKGYYFKDTSHFTREDAEAGIRVPVADGAYLLAKGAGWRFTNPGFTNVKRADGDAGLETHWGRFFDATAEGQVFDYEHQEAFFGGTLSTKLAPVKGFDIYTVLSYNQPFISSMSTVTNALKQESIGNGVDLKLGGGFSVQNSITGARISDHNTWWEEKPQLSYQVFGRPLTFIRVEYDYLHYSDANTNYWTPSHWRLLSPVLDTSIPLGKDLRIDLDARAPYEFDAHRFGFQFEGGPVLDLGSHLELGGSFIYASYPADPRVTVSRPPWSGKGGQAYLRLRF